MRTRLPGTSQFGLYLFAGVIMAVVAAATISLASQGPAQVTAASARIRLQLFDADESGTTKQVDLHTQGDFPGVGDEILEVHDVYSVRTRKVIGSTVTRIQVVRTLPGGDATFLLDCTVRLSDGTFHFTGGGNFSGLEKGVSFPIVGGTGAYRLVGGTVLVKLGALRSQKGAFLTADISR